MLLTIIISKCHRVHFDVNVICISVFKVNFNLFNNTPQPTNVRFYSVAYQNFIGRHHLHITSSMFVIGQTSMSIDKNQTNELQLLPQIDVSINHHFVNCSQTLVALHRDSKTKAIIFIGNNDYPHSMNRDKAKWDCYCLIPFS